MLQSVDSNDIAKTVDLTVFPRIGEHIWINDSNYIVVDVLHYLGLLDPLVQIKKDC